MEIVNPREKLDVFLRRLLREGKMDDAKYTFKIIMQFYDEQTREKYRKIWKEEIDNLKENIK